MSPCINTILKKNTFTELITYVYTYNSWAAKYIFIHTTFFRGEHTVSTTKNLDRCLSLLICALERFNQNSTCVSPFLNRKHSVSAWRTRPPSLQATASGSRPVDLLIYMTTRHNATYKTRNITATAAQKQRESRAKAMPITFVIPNWHHVCFC